MEPSTTQRKTPVPSTVENDTTVRPGLGLAAAGASASRSGRTSRRPGLRALPASLTPRRRPGVYLGVVAGGAVLANVLLGGVSTGETHAPVAVAEPVSVAQQLGLTADSSALDVRSDLQPLQDMAASRSAREDQQAAAQQVQAAADQAVLDQRAAEAAAAEAAAAEAAAAEAAAAAAEAATAAAAAEEAEAAAASASSGSSSGSSAGSSSARSSSTGTSSSTSVSSVARISNTSGPVDGTVQAAADAVVSNVPGAGGITLGGTRPSATDPGGHPSGLALDYMVLTNESLGDAIVAYHVAHWDELGVEYLIYQQRYLSSPGGSWSTMADRGGVTANHYDHVHVNYRG